MTEPAPLVSDHYILWASILRQLKRDSEFGHWEGPVQLTWRPSTYLVGDSERRAPLKLFCSIFGVCLCFFMKIPGSGGVRNDAWLATDCPVPMQQEQPQGAYIYIYIYEDVLL